MKKLPQTRHDAIQMRSKWYQTNRPCLRGHTGKRSTFDGACYECRVARQQAERELIRTFKE